MSEYLTAVSGAAFSVMPSRLHLGHVYVGLTDEDADMAGTHLTPAEAQGLAQRLLKEAAEVQFAASLNTAADGGES